MTNLNSSPCCLSLHEVGAMADEDPSLLQSRLVTACGHAHVAAALDALASGANVHDAAIGRSGRTETPLAAAVETAHYALVVHLLARGADPNADSAVGDVLHRSTSTVARVLIDAGWDVNRRVCLPPFLQSRNDVVWDVLSVPWFDFDAFERDGGRVEPLLGSYMPTVRKRAARVRYAPRLLRRRVVHGSYPTFGSRDGCAGGWGLYVAVDCASVGLWTY